MLRLQDVVFGEPTGGASAVKASSCRCSCISRWCWSPALAAAAAGRLVPAVAATVADEASAAELIDRAPGRPRPWPRTRSSSLDHGGAAARRGRRRRSLSLWGRRAMRAYGAARRTDAPICDADAAPAPMARSRRSARVHPPAIRLERAIRDLFGYRADRRAGRGGPGSIMAAGAIRAPLGAAPANDGPRRTVRLPGGGGARPAPDSGRPRPCRHHRARPFPLSPPTARPSCGWRSGSAMPTRASIR